MTPGGTFVVDADRLVAAARPSVENVVVHRCLDSTHAGALRLIDQAEAEEVVLPPTLIIAGEQVRGRGRAGRSWLSPTGGLYLNWIAAGLEPAVVPLLPMIAAAAAHEAIRSLGVDGVAIKWPNDLLVGGRKLAGCLVHARHGGSIWATVGLGVNLERAPALAADDGVGAVAVADLVDDGDPMSWAEGLVGVVTRELAAGVADPEPPVERWRRELCHRSGEPMTIRLGDGSTTRGRFAGLTDAGHLRLEVDGAETVITAGDVIE